MTAPTVDKFSTLASRAWRGDRRAIAMREYRRLMDIYHDEQDRLEAMRALGAAPAEIDAQRRRRDAARARMEKQAGLAQDLGINVRLVQMQHEAAFNQAIQISELP